MSDIPIDHVLDGVYISSWRATQHIEYLREHGITNVLKLYEDDPYFPGDFNTLENVLADGEPIPAETLRRGVQFVQEQVKAQHPVLVMCGAGISRSSTFVLAYLIENGHGAHDAFRLLRRAHPPAAPHFALWLSLFEHYHLDYQLRDVLDWLHEMP